MPASLAAGMAREDCSVNTVTGVAVASASVQSAAEGWERHAARTETGTPSRRRARISFRTNVSEGSGKARSK
jgi:hypothetical protein